MVHPKNSLQTHYDNLQVTRNASDEVIKGAYRYLTQRWHPDKNPDDLEKAARVTRLVNRAYEVLSDPKRRREHDTWIAQQESDVEAESEQPRPEGLVDFERREEGFNHAKGREAEAVTTHPDIRQAASTQVADGLAIYQNKAAIGWIFIGAIFFVAVGFFLLMENKTESSWVRETMRFASVYLGIPFFSVCGVVLFKKLINTSPTLVISDHGLQCNTFGGTDLRWSEIAGAKIEELYGNRFLAIMLSNPEVVMKRQSFWGRTATMFNASFMGRPPAFVIAQAAIDTPLEHIIGEISSRMPKA